MRDRDSQLIFEAFQMDRVNSLMNFFGGWLDKTGELEELSRWGVETSKNSLKKRFKSHVIEVIGNDMKRVEFLLRGNRKGREAADEMFVNFIDGIKNKEGTGDPGPKPEPEPEPEPEEEQPMHGQAAMSAFGFRSMDDTPEEELPEEDPEEKPEEDSWFGALKKGTLRIPRPPKMSFKKKEDGSRVLQIGD